MLEVGGDVVIFFVLEDGALDVAAVGVSDRRCPDVGDKEVVAGLCDGTSVGVELDFEGSFVGVPLGGELKKFGAYVGMYETLFGLPDGAIDCTVGTAGAVGSMLTGLCGIMVGTSFVLLTSEGVLVGLIVVVALGIIFDGEEVVVGCVVGCTVHGNAKPELKSTTEVKHCA